MPYPQKDAKGKLAGLPNTFYRVSLPFLMKMGACLGAYLLKGAFPDAFLGACLSKGASLGAEEVLAYIIQEFNTLIACHSCRRMLRGNQLHSSGAKQNGLNLPSLGAFQDACLGAYLGAD